MREHLQEVADFNVPVTSAEDTELIAAQRRRAVRAVASASRSAEDCALLLEALGLKPSEGIAGVPAQRLG
ncbi:hypothetical protein GCM10027445_36730 [Amycolatopsis endophytica]|uniref:Uncharacterized protein n=1 Tax=Amycolatopsis endophytica TaxID=860233 RepID=A0A853B8F3_9PSEU|nr:hypothetical protein [Amycolatopsis endophytica]NYI91052.1 hypothetical protein [Amycolatopsis endophytica]